LVNVFEIYPSDNTSVDQFKFSKEEEVPNENIDGIISDNQVTR